MSSVEGSESATATLSSLHLLQKVLADGSLKRAVQWRQHGDALRKALDAVQEHSKGVLSLECLAESAALVVVELDAHVQDELRLKIRRLRQAGDKVAEDMTTDALRSVPMTLRDVGHLVQDIQSVLLRAWKQRITREFDSLRKLGAVLQQLGIRVTVGQEMERVAKKGLRLALELPLDTDVRKAFQNALYERDRLMVNLAATDSAGDIFAFLIKVATDEASLQELNGEILDWLQREGVLRRFLVTLR